MPRVYKPDPRAKRYRAYKPDDFLGAIREIKNGMSIRQAADGYGIPYSVLRRHYKDPNVRQQGGQPILSKEEESVIVDRLIICGEWGYPLDAYGFRLFVKTYLDRRGKTVSKFKNNMPGPEFVYSFLKRHKSELSVRLCQNLKRARAAVSRDEVKTYFENLEKELKDIPPQNIINYDETNLSDDPKRKRVIVKRGCKYPERVMNSSKTSTSIMFAAAADGTLLPVYVVYKALHLYDTWIQNGPRSARYNRTASGWFDMQCFEDWIKKIVIPYCSKLPGEKVLIGDNLSSHLSDESINLCRENNIRMVFLVSNSTDKSQPLDVAFFRPTKLHWGQILTLWKQGAGRREASVPKDVFPRLLKSLLAKLEENAADNIKSGFRKCGIHPFDPQQLLSRIPHQEDYSVTSAQSAPLHKNVDGALIQILKDMRGFQNEVDKPRRQQKKRLQVEPGKSVGLISDDSDNSDNSSATDTGTSSSNENEESSEESNGSEGEDDLPPISNDKEMRNVDESETIAVGSCKKTSKEASATAQHRQESSTSAVEDPRDAVVNVDVGDYVIARFETNKRDRRYIAQVTEVDRDYVTIKGMRKHVGVKSVWFVFRDLDVSYITRSQIEKKVVLMNERRGHFTFNISHEGLE